MANDETAGSPIASAGKPFVNVSFDAYSAWDAAGNQAIYRDGDSVQNFGHGFISSVVPYRFEGGANGVPANAIADINASVVQWETQVTNFFNGDANFGAPSGRLLGFNFGAGAAEDANFDGVLQVGEDANGNGLMDGFTITWQELGIAGAVAQWLPGAQQLQFDGTVNWFFGGAGNIPAGMTDFFTIAMHELGHVIGLNHINSGVAGRTMRSDIILQATAAGTTGVRTADIGSVFGATALYVIPEPGTLFLVGLGTLVLGLRRRRRRSC